MPHRWSKRVGPYALVRSLAWLRISAIIGQSVAVLACAWWLALPIPVLPLLAGIGLLAVFAMVAAWRLTQPWPVQEWEAIGHIAIDTLVLGYLLYFTGGANNPFVTLLLVPIALSAAALSGRTVLVVSACAGVTYATLTQVHVPLPLAAEPARSFRLHVIGTSVNFAIMALLLAFFISRLAGVLRRQQREVQQVRERALRDEGILAIATQAAGAAHELNTPLSTMRTLLPELRREYAGDATLTEDLALLEGQVDRCRTILRELVAFGKAQLSREPTRLTVSAFIHGCLERFQLLRPEAELNLVIDTDIAETSLRVPPGLRHSLINLLNNAADASASRQSHALALRVTRDGDWLRLGVFDHGPGIGAAGDMAGLGYSEKQTGLGIGLALAQATAERLNGELIARNTGQGAEVCLRLPLVMIADK